MHCNCRYYCVLCILINKKNKKIKKKNKKNKKNLYLFQKLISKSFSEEIRAAKDVETFLERPTLLLGLNETSLQGIVDKILELISVIGGDDIDFEEARMAFVAHDSGYQSKDAAVH